MKTKEKREKGTIKSEKAEGAATLRKELKNGTEMHKSSAKKALKQLTKKKGC